MKKLLVTALLAMTMATTPITAFAGTAYISFNGDIVDGEAYLLNGTTYVPVRTIAGLFDVDIDWSKQKQAVLLNENTESYISGLATSKTDKTVKNDGDFYSNHSVTVHMDNKEVKLEDANGNKVYAKMRSGANYLPVRAISNAFGCDVSWENITSTVVLKKEMPKEEVKETVVPTTDESSKNRPEGYAGGTYFVAGWKSSAMSTYGRRAKMLVAEYDKTEDHSHGIWRTYTDNDYSTYMDNYNTDENFIKYEIQPGTSGHAWVRPTEGGDEYFERGWNKVNLGEQEIRNTCGKALKLTMTGNGTCPDQVYIIPDGDTVILMPMKDGSGAKCIWSYADGTGLLAQFYWDSDC